MLRRGGYDCSLVYCLNECTGHGECIDGTCACADNYHGDDCSVFISIIKTGAIDKIR